MADHTLEDLGEVGDAPVTRGFEADTKGPSSRFQPQSAG